MSIETLEIHIASEDRTDKGWSFEVIVDDAQSDQTTHFVFLDEEYWELFSNMYDDPRSLITRSFEFLLERESSQSILPQFNLSDISTYFPEYEEEMMVGV